MFKLLSFFVVLGVALASVTTPVKKCPGFKEELFKKVSFYTPKGVCTKLPCDIYGGMYAKANVTFDVRSTVSKIYMKCNATALYVTIPYPLPDADKGCDKLTNTYCPIDPNTEAELSMSMDVKKGFPKVLVDLVFYFVDQSQKIISCFSMSAKVKQ